MPRLDSQELADLEVASAIDSHECDFIGQEFINQESDFNSKEWDFFGVQGQDPVAAPEVAARLGSGSEVARDTDGTLESQDLPIVINTSETKELAIKRGPGRPPKKKRGRPAKAAVPETDFGQDTRAMSSPAPVTSNRAPGPMVGKRKTRSTSSALPSASAAMEAVAVTVTKRRPGRPKGVRKAEPPARRGRAEKKTLSRKAALEKFEAHADDKEWEVERILDDQIDEDGVHFFQVKWKGFSASESTWEPKTHLGNCKEQIKAYQTKKGRK